MRQLQPVLWAKGVMLTPQHLQIQDRYVEDLLSFRLSGLTFFPWGFHRLEVNREELAAGSFALTAAAGVFPDGLSFDIPGSDAAPAPRPLKECWDPDQQTLDVHLTIPEYRVGGHNVATAEPETGTRYRAEVVMRRDENTGLSEKPVQVARKNFRILVGGEALEGSAALPVARVRRVPTGDYELDPHFVPPLIDFSASEYLVAIARRLVEVLSGKSATIAGGRRQRKQSLAEFGVGDVASFWLLYTVNSHLPLARHLLEQQHAHPAALYEAMMGLAGALTTFSDRIHPRDLPAYDHTDLSGCFTTLDGQLRELLATVVPERCVSLPLRLVSPSVYATALDDDRYLQAPQMFLAVRSSASVTDLRRAPRLLKLSAADRLERLIKQALPGVELTHVAQPPGAIPVKLDYQYFELSRQGPDWDGIALARNVAVYAPADLPDIELELVILLPEQRAGGGAR
jgi:type VI secretion system protein ImpJ